MNIVGLHTAHEVKGYLPAPNTREIAGHYDERCWNHKKCGHHCNDGFPYLPEFRLSAFSSGELQSKHSCIRLT